MVVALGLTIRDPFNPFNGRNYLSTCCKHWCIRLLAVLAIYTKTSPPLEYLAKAENKLFVCAQLLQRYYIVAI